MLTVIHERSPARPSSIEGGKLLKILKLSRGYSQLGFLLCPQFCEAVVNSSKPLPYNRYSVWSWLSSLHSDNVHAFVRYWANHLPCLEKPCFNLMRQLCYNTHVTFVMAVKGYYVSCRDMSHKLSLLLSYICLVESQAIFNTMDCMLRKLLM